MTRELKHFEAISFYKSIIGANKMIDVQKKNMPGEFQTYPHYFCKSFQDHGHFQIREEFILPHRKL